MRFILDRALFAPQSEAEAVGLLDLLCTIARDTHAHPLLTDPLYQAGVDNGPIDAWLRDRSSWEVNAFRALLGNGPVHHRMSPLSVSVSDTGRPRRWHIEGSLTIRVERRGASDWKNRKLTITDAADLLREPIHLVLENARTDMAFVHLLAGPTHGQTLQVLARQPGRIMRHGGGSGEGKRWLERLATAPPTPQIWRQLLRTWVLFDKDAGDLDVCDLSSGAVALMELCEKVVLTHGEGLSWICLLRREIESFAPDSALLAEALQTQKTFVNQVISWRTTQPRWAWALDLKKGLRGDLQAKLSNAERRDLKECKIPLVARMLKTPFSGLPPADISALDGGLGDRLGEAFRAEPVRAWASDLPAEYDRGPADQAPRLSFVQSLLDRI